MDAYRRNDRIGDTHLAKKLEFIKLFTVILAFKAFGCGLLWLMFVQKAISIDEESVSNTDEFDDELGNELNSALEHVRDLAESHREDFVNAVCDNISAESGQQQMAEELTVAFL